jgi:hypothetical protein
VNSANRQITKPAPDDKLFLYPSETRIYMNFLAIAIAKISRETKIRESQSGGLTENCGTGKKISLPKLGNVVFRKFECRNIFFRCRRWRKVAFP